MSFQTVAWPSGPSHGEADETVRIPASTNGLPLIGEQNIRPGMAVVTVEDTVVDTVLDAVDDTVVCPVDVPVVVPEEVTDELAVDVTDDDPVLETLEVALVDTEEESVLEAVLVSEDVRLLVRVVCSVDVPVVV